MEEAKKIKCYKRLIYKQLFQVSGLCSPQFLSYLPKRLTHLCRALYGDAILLYSFGAPIWPPEIKKKTPGVYDKHPLELGAYSKSALHGRFGYFLELYKVVYPGIYSIFYKVVISSFFPTAVVLRVVE